MVTKKYICDWFGNRGTELLESDIVYSERIGNWLFVQIADSSDQLYSELNEIDVYWLATDCYELYTSISVDPKQIGITSDIKTKYLDPWVQKKES